MNSKLAGDVLNLLNELTLEKDEDSCMGMTFITGRVSEDWFYDIMFALEKEVSNDTKNVTQQTHDIDEIEEA
jgi:hypothetical protein